MRVERRARHHSLDRHHRGVQHSRRTTCTRTNRCERPPLRDRDRNRSTRSWASSATWDDLRLGNLLGEEELNGNVFGGSRRHGHRVLHVFDRSVDLAELVELGCPGVEGIDVGTRHQGGSEMATEVLFPTPGRPEMTMICGVHSMTSVCPTAAYRCPSLHLGHHLATRCGSHPRDCQGRRRDVCAVFGSARRVTTEGLSPGQDLTVEHEAGSRWVR